MAQHQSVLPLQMPEPELCVVVGRDGFASARSFTFNRREQREQCQLLVGRSAVSNVVVDDPAMDGCRVFFEYVNGHWWVVDRGSIRAPWFTGGIRLQPDSPRRIPPRCWMRVGATWLSLTVAAGCGADRLTTPISDGASNSRVFGRPSE